MDACQLALSRIYGLRGVPCDEEVTTTAERRAVRRDKFKDGAAELKEDAETGSNWPAITSHHSTGGVWLSLPASRSRSGTCVLNRLKECNDGTTRSTVSGRIRQRRYLALFAVIVLMTSKPRLLNDNESLSKILKSSRPNEAMALGRKVRKFDEVSWKTNARRLVTEGSVAKFNQNTELKAFLVATDHAVLVEASPCDRIWGIGLKATDERTQHPIAREGQNLLGFALMDVRKSVR